MSVCLIPRPMLSLSIESTLIVVTCVDQCSNVRMKVFESLFLLAALVKYVTFTSLLISLMAYSSNSCFISSTVRSSCALAKWKPLYTFRASSARV